MDSKLRAQVWPFLLGVYSPCSTTAERAAQLKVQKASYASLVSSYQAYEARILEAIENSDNSLKAFDGQNSFKTIINDARRTGFRTASSSSTTTAARMRLVKLHCAYIAHDPEINYCQGMTDLAIPFLQVYDDDALAFACYERFMRNARENFMVDGSGIQRQLNRISEVMESRDTILQRKLEKLEVQPFDWAYKMLLVLLRRALPLDQAMTLWEMKWALEAQNTNGNDFILGFIVEIACSLRHSILRKECNDLTDVLQLFNVAKIDFWKVLARVKARL